MSTRPEPFNSTPMGINSISSGSPHVRPMAWGVRVVSQTKSRKSPPEIYYRSFSCSDQVPGPQQPARGRGVVRPALP